MVWEPGFLKVVLAILAVALVTGVLVTASARPRKPDHRAAASEAALKTLEPRFEKKVRRVLKALKAKGWQPVVISGRRSVAQQRKIVAAGRSRTMKSYHLCGRAADIMDRRHGWRGPAANPNFKFWRDLGVAARAEGLEWGGDWKRIKDVPHVQIGPRCGQNPPAARKPAPE